MLEALRLGKAVVATSAAAEGLRQIEPAAWLTVNSVQECVEGVVSLLGNTTTRMRLEDSAFVYGQRFLSQEVILAQVRTILPSRLTSTILRMLSL
jgi:hypothetical protein